MITAKQSTAIIEPVVPTVLFLTRGISIIKGISSPGMFRNVVEEETENLFDISELIKVERSGPSLEERFIEGDKLERSIQDAYYVPSQDNFRKLRAVYSLLFEPRYLVSSVLVQARTPAVYRVEEPIVAKDEVIYALAYSSNKISAQFAYSEDNGVYALNYTASSSISEFRPDYVPMANIFEILKIDMARETPYQTKTDYMPVARAAEFLRLDLDRERGYSIKSDLPNLVVREAPVIQEYRPQTPYIPSKIFEVEKSSDVKALTMNYASFSNPLPTMQLAETKPVSNYNPETVKSEIRNVENINLIPTNREEKREMPALVYEAKQNNYLKLENRTEVVMPTETKEINIEKYVEERLFLPNVRDNIDILSPVPITEQLKLLKQEKVGDNSKTNQNIHYKTEERTESNAISNTGANFTIDTKVYDAKKPLETERQRKNWFIPPYSSLDNAVMPREAYSGNNRISSLFGYERTAGIDALMPDSRKTEPLQQKRETGYCNTDTESRFYQKAIEFAFQRKKYACGGELAERFHLDDPRYRLAEYVRNGETLDGFLKVASFRAINKEGKTKVNIYDAEKNESKPTEELFDNNTVIAQIDMYLKSIGATPVWERQYFINTETGKRESGLILTAVAEYHLEAKRRLGEKDKGLLIFLDGYEPGKGSIPVDKIMTNNNPYIAVVYKKDGCMY